MSEVQKEWKRYDGAVCLKCGSTPEVLTKSTKNDWVYDGEKARCPECGLEGQVETDGECADIYWDDDIDEEDDDE